LEPYYKFDASIIEGTFSGIVVDEKVALASTQVYNGNLIKLQTTTSSDFNTPKNIQVRVGTFTTSWTATTELENLNITFTPTDFTDQTRVNRSTDIDSDWITLSGFSLNSDLPVTLSNTNAKYEVERNSSIVKSFDASSPIEVVNNDKIRLRLTSSASYSTAVTTTMTIGNTSADWSVTTRSAPPPPTPPPPSGGGSTGGGGTTYDLQNVYRFWDGKGKHVVSLSKTVSGYTNEQTLCKTFKSNPKVANIIGIFTAGLTVDANGKDAGVGFAYDPAKTKPNNTTTLYRLVRDTPTKDEMWSNSPTEGTERDNYRLSNVNSGRVFYAPTKSLTV
jgi:hypothetical protein